ncbi:response regulator [Paraburkholderia graminis]|uniref:response regulator n=1 Tax=Paraburkholderia graminis TaxID=60548 RepID=UPI000DEECFB6|nr:response regulator [Paraburkholderia graminis]
MDDELSVASACKRLLQLEGYRVVTASEGHAGLVVAKEAAPDFIITDRAMPILDGVEFCRQLKLKPELARIPLILSSAEPLRPGDTGRWDEFWQKPVPTETIRASLLRLLSCSG